MGEYNLTIPSMGEGIYEVKILRWLKQKGEIIKKDEILLEIATDKIDSEIISPVTGIIKKIFFDSTQIAKIGSLIAIIEISNKYICNKNFLKNTINNNYYSPLVKNISKKEGINLYELNCLNGSGSKGRIIKKDIIKYLTEKKKKININKLSEIQKYHKYEEIIPMDRIRQITSEKMINSKKISAHVTSFIEADITDVVKWRNRIKHDFIKKTGEKFTLMSIFVKCVAKAIHDYPMINVSINKKNIIKKKYINIGIATALSNGNVVVPVIKNADTYNLIELIKIINDLVYRARLYQLCSDEINDGTYTISNIGSFGNIFGTPIIHQPQVAIMAIGVIKKKLSIIDTPNGDVIGIRYKIYLSHSYDHRIIDGLLGCKFIRQVTMYLEKFKCKL